MGTLPFIFSRIRQPFLIQVFLATPIRVSWRRILMRALSSRTAAITGLSLAAAIIGLLSWRLSGWEPAPSEKHLVTTGAAEPLGEFTIGEGPRLILLPVTIKNRTFLFLVDTGAWKS